MRIVVHDDVLIASMPDACAPRFIDAAVSFGRLLQTAYKDILGMKHPGDDVEVEIDVKLVPGFDHGLTVDMTAPPGALVNEPELIQDLLAQVRERTYQTWAQQAGIEPSCQR